MLRVLLPLVIAASIFAQTPPPAPEKAPQENSQPAPPEVDAALRARINEFYQLEVKGKFNEALKLVADDTKDFFVGSSKPSYQSLNRIDSIQYSDNFTHASVIVLLNRILAVEGFAGRPLPTKISSRWKLENGQWYWYVDPAKLPRSPFGPGGMPAPGGMAPTGKGPATRRGARKPGDPPLANQPMSPTLVRVDKGNIQFKASGPGSDHVTILNPSAMPTDLILADPKIPGLTVKLDSTTLQSAGKTNLTVDWSGAGEAPKVPVMILVTVSRTRQKIPIRVTFLNR